jgi:uncharacterized coiled-coil protein SlyX
MTTETTNVAYCKRLDKLNKIQMDILSFCAHHFSKSGRFLSSEVLEKMEEQKVATAIAEDNGLKKMSKQIIGQALGAAAKKLPTVIQDEIVYAALRGYRFVGEWDASKHQWENPPKLPPKTRKTMSATGRLAEVEKKLDHAQRTVAELKSSVAAMDEDLRKTREMMRKLFDRVSVLLDGVGGKYSPPVSTRAASEVLVGDTFKRFGDEKIGERVRDD